MFEIKESKLKEANKAFKSYLRLFRQQGTNEITFQDFFNNRILVVHAIQRGIPFTLFQHIKGLTPFSDKDWAVFLDLSVKSLQRYKLEKAHVFKPIHSEKIIELTEVALFGLEIFDSPQQFYLWLNTPSYALGNFTPLDLLKNSYGKDLVVSELNRINEGIFV